VNYDGSVNATRFCAYLRRLRQENPDRKIALFMDRLAVHRSPKSRQQMTDLGFEVIFNASYTPET